MRMPPGARILAVAVMVIAASACDDSQQSLRPDEDEQAEVTTTTSSTTTTTSPTTTTTTRMVTICHATPPDNPNKYEEITIAAEAAAAHKRTDKADIIPAPAGGCPTLPTTTTAVDTTTTTTDVDTTTTTTDVDTTTTTTDVDTTTTTTDVDTTTTTTDVDTTTTTTDVDTTTTTTDVDTTTTTTDVDTTTTSPDGTTTTTSPDGTTTTTVGAVAPIVEPQAPVVLGLGCVDCPEGPTIQLPATPGVVYEVEPAGPWEQGQTVTVHAQAVDSASGFAEALPEGWTAVDSSSATFELTLASPELARTGPTSVVPQAIAAAAAIALGSLLLVVRGRRRSAP